MTRHNNKFRREYNTPLPPPMIVETPNDLAMMQHALKGIDRVAIDTESNSLHAYQPQVCLIQLSTDWEDFIIDPLVLDVDEHLAFLGEMCASDHVEKILHAAEYDVMTLRRDFNWSFSRVFDTMIAARVLGWERVGLGNILEDRYGVSVNKRHQRADWGRRPLQQELVRYAQMDTHFLPDVRDHLHMHLESGGHVEEAWELFDEVCQAEWTGSTGLDPEGYWEISHARDLSPRQIAVLRELYLMREHEAKRKDVPVFKIMGDKTLIELAKAKPRTLQEISRVNKVSGYHVDRYGDQIADAIQRGLHTQPPDPPARNGRPVNDDILRRYDALHTWRKERATERGVSSEIVISKDALWELARRAPHTWEELKKVEAIGPWRTETYGDEILGVISGVG